MIQSIVNTHTVKNLIYSDDDENELVPNRFYIDNEGDIYAPAKNKFFWIKLKDMSLINRLQMPLCKEVKQGTEIIIKVLNS